MPGVAATLPTAARRAENAATGSLYNPASFTGLASDRRARRVGDLLTIRLVERTQARKSATADSSRDGSTSITLPDVAALFLCPRRPDQGRHQARLQGQRQRGAGQPAVGRDSPSRSRRVLPGGVLMVAGEKRLTLNRGEEQVQLTGLVRIDDLGPDNSVPSHPRRRCPHPLFGQRPGRRPEPPGLAGAVLCQGGAAVTGANFSLPPGERSEPRVGRVGVGDLGAGSRNPHPSPPHPPLRGGEGASRSSSSASSPCSSPPLPRPSASRTSHALLASAPMRSPATASSSACRAAATTISNIPSSRSNPPPRGWASCCRRTSTRG